MRTSSQTGFTLTELLVSSAIGLFTLAVAVQMASDHTAILSQTTSKMDMYQSARTAVELLGEDLRHAGLGVGYRPDGRFAGLMRGSFQVQGGATFTADGLTQTLSTGSIPTDDLGIRLAMGDLRTIASFSGSQGQICAGSGHGGRRPRRDAQPRGITRAYGHLAKQECGDLHPWAVSRWLRNGDLRAVHGLRIRRGRR